MSEDEGVGRGSEGDCAVWVIFDQDTDRHGRRWTRAEEGCAGASIMLGVPLHVKAVKAFAQV